MGTNKKVLMKGIKYLGWALPLFFMGPVIIHSSFKNQEHPFYIPILGVGITLCLLAIVFVFMGLHTIMRSMFNN